MKVSFSVGKNSDVLINKISKHYDDIEFYSYNNVKDMIKESNTRHIYFDRIVFSEKLLRNPQEDLRVLNDYIVNYSESTTIVLIVEKANTEAALLFQEIFNSPLYTTVVLRIVNTLILCDIVSKDILEVKTKYFTLSEDENLQNHENTPSEEPKKKPRSRLGVFGGKKVEKVDSETAPKEGKEVEENSQIYAGTNSPEFAQKNPVSTEKKVENSSGGYYGVQNEQETILGFGDSPRVSLDSEKENEDFSGYSEDDFLGLGSYGSHHSDTGFMDLDEIEEEKYKSSSGKGTNQNSENGGEDEGSENQKSDGISEDDDYENDEYESTSLEERFSESDIRSLSKVLLVTGERGVGVTSYIADLVYVLFKRGESVLVVDCDYKRNGILSFIDSRDFYEKGHEDGIDSLNPYVDEEADIVSNGYGSLMTKSSIVKLVTDKNIQLNYDRIILDCPLDCMNVMSERVVRGNTVLVLAKGDRASLIATSIGLTDKTVMELSLERYIMNNCNVALSNISDGFEEDLDFIKETIMFPNGCWLDRLGQGVDVG